MGVSVLTDVAVRKAAPKESPYKLSDAQGLYLLVKPNGTKLWRLKYRFGGKEKALSFGAYSEISLINARRARESAREDLRNGQDPSLTRQPAIINLGPLRRMMRRIEHTLSYPIIQLALRFLPLTSVWPSGSWRTSRRKISSRVGCDRAVRATKADFVSINRRLWMCWMKSRLSRTCLVQNLESGVTHRTGGRSRP